VALCAILLKNVIIDPRAQVRLDIERDCEGFSVTESAIIVVGKGIRVTA